jgi:uncharacterized membrane protein HdeD (DUF308 family)
VILGYYTHKSIKGDLKMKVPKVLSNLLFAIFMIIFGLTFFGITFTYIDVILGILAIVVGVLKFLGR